MADRDDETSARTRSIVPESALDAAEQAALSRVPADRSILSKADPLPTYLAEMARATPERTVSATATGGASISETEAAPGSTGVAPTEPTSAAADYRLREFVARGGQGEVWRALQSSLQREVAVKIHRRGEPLEFLQEAYASGELDHPNIVPVYELGQAEVEGEKRHLLAMKFVSGTNWQELLKADWAEGALQFEPVLAKHLPILIAVCNAVAYAHSKGIIHRDLKPHQVVIGAFGEVYLMDWGLAVYTHTDKPMVEGETAMPKLRTLETATNRCGSPAYMAPEQTRLSPRVLGTHTDIYLLGAILHQIVTGKPPHTAETADRAFLRASLNELEPPPPRVPAELKALLRSSLATEPELRPRTVVEFRRAVEEYLSGAGRRRESEEIVAEARQTLEATKGGDLYDTFGGVQQRLSRALQLWPENPSAHTLLQDVYARHAAAALEARDLTLARTLARSIAEDDGRRASLLDRIEQARARIAAEARQRRIAIGAAFVLLFGVGAAALLALRESSQRQVAEERAQRERDRAAETQRTADLLRRISELRTAESALAARIARELPMPKAVAATEDVTAYAVPESVSAPLLAERARLRGERAELERLADEGIDAEPYELLVAEANLATSRATTRDEYLRAYTLYETAAHARPERPEPLTGMGVAASRAGHPTSATLHFSHATSATLALVGPQHEDYARALAFEAKASQDLGADTSRFVQLYRESSKVLEPQWVALGTQLIHVSWETGEPERAEIYSSPTLQIATELFGEADPRTASVWFAVGQAKYAVSRIAEAAAAHRRGIAIAEAAGEADSIQTFRLYGSLASALIELGDYREAVRISLEQVEKRERRFGRRHVLTASALNAVAESYLRQGEFESALKYAQESYEIRVALLGDEHPMVSASLITLAAIHRDFGRFQEAVDYYGKSVEIARKALGPNARSVLFGRIFRARVLGEMGRVDESLAEWEMLLADARVAAKWDSGPLGSVLEGYSSALMEQDEQANFERAVQMQRQSIGIRMKNLGRDHLDMGFAYNNMGVVYARNGQRDQALRFLLKGLSISRTHLGAEHPETLINYANIAQCLRNIRRSGDAITIMLHALRAGLRQRPIDFTDNEYLLRVLMISSFQHVALADAPDRAHNLVVGMPELLRLFPDDAMLNRNGVFNNFIAHGERLTSAVLCMDSPREDLAAPMVYRLALLSGVTQVRADDDFRVEFLDPMIRRFNLADKIAAAPAPPEEVLAVRAGSVPAKTIREWIDRVAPMPNWHVELPAIVGKFDTLRPSPEIAEPAFEALLRRLEEEFPFPEEELERLAEGMLAP